MGHFWDGSRYGTFAHDLAGSIKSPDPNPIENLWRIIKLRVSKPRRNLTSLEEMKKVVRHRHCELVILARGSEYRYKFEGSRIPLLIEYGRYLISSFTSLLYRMLSALSTTSRLLLEVVAHVSKLSRWRKLLGKLPVLALPVWIQLAYLEKSRPQPTFLHSHF